MKKIIYCSLIISVIIGITGCASRPEEVELKTSKDIVKYARKNFGKAKYVEQESGKNSVKYTLQDNEYKFNYECVSKVDNFPCSSLYYETTECNFEEKYRNYIFDRIYFNNVTKPDDFTSYCITGDHLFDVTYENQTIAKQNIEKIAKKIMEIDKRKYFLHYSIDIFDKEGQWISSYDLATKKYTYECPYEAHEN